MKWLVWKSLRVRSHSKELRQLHALLQRLLHRTESVELPPLLRAVGEGFEPTVERVG